MRRETREDTREQTSHEMDQETQIINEMQELNGHPNSIQKQEPNEGNTTLISANIKLLVNSYVELYSHLLTHETRDQSTKFAMRAFDLWQIHCSIKFDTNNDIKCYSGGDRRRRRHEEVERRLTSVCYRNR